jgi:GrpB-like predicted nucleotidyltransferase (UPF0157 family)
LAQIFDVEATKIRAALVDSLLEIHHVGSTAVEGLSAKPKIDIVACVNNLDFDYQGLINLNYEYRGGFNLPFRRTFTYRSIDLNINLHVFEKDDPEVELNLLFRDYLRSYPEARKEYAALKYRLLQDEANHKKDRAMYRGYTLGKSDWIEGIIRQTGFNGLRFVICTHYREWDAVKKFRNQYFCELNAAKHPFAPTKTSVDNYTWTFDHVDHKHVVLYKGMDIIGYAHIQLWPEKRATLHIIIIDKKYQGKGYGKTLMALIEKWMGLEGYKSDPSDTPTGRFL